MGKSLVFIDFDNIYRGMLEVYGVQPTDKNKDNIDLFDIITSTEAEKGNTIEEIFAYADYKYIGDTQYRTQLEERGIQPVDVSSTNRNMTRKNASDIQLSIEAVDAVYGYDDVGNYVIVSADSDMIPIINYLKLRKRKKVSLYILAKKANVAILSKTPNNGFYTIEDKLLLAEPENLTIDEIESYIPQIVRYIHSGEVYNTENARARIYSTQQALIWNVMRYHRIGKRRPSQKNVLQVLEYISSKDFIKVEYNTEYEVNEIKLNRFNEKVKEILKNT